MKIWLFVLLLLLIFPLALYYYYITHKRISTQVTSVNIPITTAQSNGLVNTSQMSSLIFLGHDYGSMMCYQHFAQVEQKMVQPIDQPFSPYGFLCPLCGAENDPESNFCASCGGKLKVKSF